MVKWKRGDNNNNNNNNDNKTNTGFRDDDSSSKKILESFGDKFDDDFSEIL